MKLKEKPNTKQIEVVISFMENNWSGRKSTNSDMIEFRAERKMYPKFIEFDNDRLGGLMSLSPLIKDKEAAKIAAYCLPRPKGSTAGFHNRVANIKRRLAILDEYLKKLKEAA